MRTQLLFSVFVGIAVSGCGQCEYSCVPQNAADAESPGEFIPEDVPYSLIETMDDGSQVIQYCVEVMHPQTEITTDSNGREVVHTVMVSSFEERIATLPPGEDISEFLSLDAGGRIIAPEPDASFDGPAEPAPAPPAPPES